MSASDVPGGALDVQPQPVPVAGGAAVQPRRGAWQVCCCPDQPTAMRVALLDADFGRLDRDTFRRRVAAGFVPVGIGVAAVGTLVAVGLGHPQTGLLATVVLVALGAVWGLSYQRRNHTVWEGRWYTRRIVTVPQPVVDVLWRHRDDPLLAQVVCRFAAVSDGTDEQASRWLSATVDQVVTSPDRTNPQRWDAAIAHTNGWQVAG